MRWRANATVAANRKSCQSQAPNYVTNWTQELTDSKSHEEADAEYSRSTDGHRNSRVRSVNEPGHARPDGHDPCDDGAPVDSIGEPVGRPRRRFVEVWEVEDALLDDVVVDAEQADHGTEEYGVGG